MEITSVENKTGFDLTQVKNSQQDLLNKAMEDRKIGDYPVPADESPSLEDPELGNVESRSNSVNYIIDY